MIFIMYAAAIKRLPTQKKIGGKKMSVDLRQCYNHAKFERPRLNSVQEKSNVKVFVKSLTTLISSLQYKRKSKTEVHT